MKKIFISILVIGVFTVGFLGNSYATPLINVDDDDFEDINEIAYAHYANSGELMFIKTENNEGNNFNNGTVEGYVEDWLTTYYYSLFDITTFVLATTTSTTISTPSDGDSGTWAVTPSSDVISFYAVKADNAYAMYFVNPADNTGSWSTYDLFVSGVHPATSSGLEISHFTAYNPTSNPIPEPATMLLFGTGLVGLVGSRLRKEKK